MRTARIMICGIILTLALFFPMVAADNDSMKVLMTIDRDEKYSGGDTGKVTVHVFDKGEYIDPDEIPDCKISGGYSSNEVERDITLEKKSTGIYESDFKIYTSDADDLNSMTIRADATYGKSDENDTEYNMDEDNQRIGIISEDDEDEEVTVSIINSPLSAFPGDTFTLRIEVEKGGVLTDAEDLDIIYELCYDESESDESDLPYDKVGTGIYEAVLEVPKSIKESCDIDIEAEATIDEDSDSDYESVRVDFFSVWYKEGSIGQTICTFDVYVADTDGKALSDADIKLNWDEERRSSENEATKLTDGSGKASFEITYDEDADNLEISGKVMKGGKTQFFSGDIELKENGGGEDEWEEPDDYGLDVVIKDDDITGKSPYTLECRAFLDGQRISKKEVYYYLYNDLKVIAHGAGTTDIDGEFSLTFSHSSSGSFETIRACFETAAGDYEGWGWDERQNTLDGKEYDYENEYLWFEDDDILDIDFDDTSIKINVEKLKRGGLTEVTVTGIPEDFIPHVSWVPASVNSVEDIDQWEETFEWKQWGGEGTMAQDTSVSDGKVTCKLMIPEFMPSGKYTVFAGYIDTTDMYEPDFSLEDAYHINNVIVEPGKSGTSTQGTESSFVESTGFIVLIVGILVVLLGVVIVIILMVKREKRKSESPGMAPPDQSQQAGGDFEAQEQAETAYPPPYETQAAAPGTTAYPPPYESQAPKESTTYPAPQENYPHLPVQQQHVAQQEQYPPPSRPGGYPPPPY